MATRVRRASPPKTPPTMPPMTPPLDEELEDLPPLPDEVPVAGVEAEAVVCTMTTELVWVPAMVEVTSVTDGP